MSIVKYTVKNGCNILICLLTFSNLIGAGKGDQEIIFRSKFTTPKAIWKQFKKVPNSDKCMITGGVLETILHEKKSGGIEIIPLLAKPLPDVWSVELQIKIRKVKGGVIILKVGKTKFVSYGGPLVTLGKDMPKIVSANLAGNSFHTVIIVREPNKVTLAVDGRKVQPVPLKGLENNFCVSLFNADVAIKSIVITPGNALTKLQGANLLRNGSFEDLANGFPVYWGSHGFGVNNIDWVLNMDKFRSEFRVDSSEACHGKYSFRMKKTNAPDDYKALWECWQTLLPDTDYTVSAYMKADHENAKLKITAVESYNSIKQNIVSLGKEWKRYKMTFKSNSGRNLRVGFYPNTPGVFHVDAVQLEEGASLTDFKLCESDILQEKKHFVRPEFFIVQGGKPVIDGELNDSVWGSSKQYTLVNKNKPPQEKTIVRVAVDDQNIYFGVECFCRDITKLRETVRKDKGPVWNDDDVEFFFLTKEDGDGYYQFAINSLGFTNEIATQADIAWQGRWTHVVKKHSDRYVVETAIPWSSLELAGKPSKLFFNIGRSNPNNKEVSALSSEEGEKILFAKHRYWGFTKLHGKATKNKRKAVDLKLALFPEYSYFSGEKKLNFKLTLPVQKRSPGNIEWQLVSSSNNTITSGKTPYTSSEEIIIDVPNKNFQEGNYIFKAKLGAISIETPCKIKTVQPFERKINMFRRTLYIGGKEFFGFGILWDGKIKNIDKFNQLLSKLGKYGINHLILWQPCNFKSTQWAKKILDSAKDHNFMISYNFSSHGGVIPDSQISVIKSFIKHDALLMVQLFDESYGKPLDKFKNREANKIRLATDGRVPLWHNEFNLGVLNKADYSHFDIASMDEYGIYNNESSKVYNFMKILSDCNRQKVINCIVLGGANFSNLWREPTAKEVLNQAYQAYTNEIFNIMWFGDIPYTAPVLPAVEQAKKELDAIEPGKFLDGKKVDVFCDSEFIKLTARQKGKKLILISVNITRNKVPSATFKLPVAGKNIIVKFENRTVPVTKYRFSDHFKPLERHVYEITVK